MTNQNHHTNHQQSVLQTHDRALLIRNKNKKFWALTLAILTIVSIPFGGAILDTIINIGQQAKPSVTSTIAFGYVESDNLKAIKSLERSDIISIKDEHNRTLLMLAAFLGNYRIVKYIIKQDPIIDRKDQRGNTALIYSIKDGHEKTIKLLIKHKANVNSANLMGVTPLIAACREGTPEIAELLIQNGADINKTDLAMFTPIMHAIGSNKPDIASVLINKHHADVGIVGSNGYNALMLAIEQKMIKMALQILPQTSHLRSKNAHGENALHIAIRQNLPSIVSAILSKDPSMIVENLNGIRPINIRPQNKVINLVLKQHYKMYKELPQIYPSTQKIKNLAINSMGQQNESIK